MAYATAGLRHMHSGVINEFALDTVDSVATATGAGYVTDGTSSTTNATPGRGMQMGDVVLIRVVGALAANGSPPASCTDQAWAFVSTANTTTGACSLTLTHTNA
jgi:hypothetical protein